MLMKRLAITAAIQSLGTLGTFVATIVAARKFGAEGQGFLSLFRSSMDMIASIGLFGLPQAFVFLINTRALSVQEARRMAVRHTAWVGSVALGVLALLWGVQLQPDLGLSSGQLLCAIIAGILLVLYGLQRSISLTGHHIAYYNVITAAPGLFVLAVYAFWPNTDYLTLDKAWIAIAAALVVLSMFLQQCNNYPQIEPAEPIRMRRIFRYGGMSFMTEIVSTAAILGTYWFLHRTTGGHTASGYFSAAFFLLSCCLLPITMVGPVIFSHWSQADATPHSIWRAHRQLAHLGTVLSLILAGASWLLTPWAVDVIFGRAFQPAVLASLLLLGGFYLFFQTRILANAHYARGTPHWVAAGGVARAGLILGAGWGGLLITAEAAALAWLLAEIISFLLLIFTLPRQQEGSRLDLLGLSPRWLLAQLSQWRIGSGHIK